MTENPEILNRNTLYELLKEANLEQTNEIKREINSSAKEILAKVEDNTKQITKLENKIEFLEKKLRRNNIVIFGLNISDPSNVLNETIQKLNDLLGTDISELDINNIHLANKNANSKSPPIFLEFVSLLRKQSVFVNVRKLKGTGIVINHDLSRDDRIKQKILVGHLKNAKEQNLAARIKGNKLEINSRVYTVDELKELENVRDESSEGESEDEEEIQETQIELNMQESDNQIIEGKKDKKLAQKRKRSKVVYSPKTRHKKQEAQNLKKLYV